jgi:hypothetical protein
MSAGLVEWFVRPQCGPLTIDPETFGGKHDRVTNLPKVMYLPRRRGLVVSSLLVEFCVVGYEWRYLKKNTFWNIEPGSFELNSAPELANPDLSYLARLRKM